MKVETLKPLQILNKVYLKDKPIIQQYEAFQKRLTDYLDAIEKEHANDQTEEHLKKRFVNLIEAQFASAIPTPDSLINTVSYNGAIAADISIKRGSQTDDPTITLVETKKPSGPEMPDAEKPNRKALHEILLYLLYETYSRQTQNPGYTQLLILTDCFRVWIIRAEQFRFLLEKLKKTFLDWEARETLNRKTQFMHEQIERQLEAFFPDEESALQVAEFDLRDYRVALQQPDVVENRRKLVTLFVLFSPRFLLQLPPANDANLLDEDFYGELLYILGLHEVQRGDKVLIERLPEAQRRDGNFYEQVDKLLERSGSHRAYEKAYLYGESLEDQKNGIIFELITTWVNRVLFLKLLEAQLIAWHKDPQRAFLNTEIIPDFSFLSDLFFDVLNKSESERKSKLPQGFSRLPYLNSSLFEMTELEKGTVWLESLAENQSLGIWGKTKIVDKYGRVDQPPKGPLEYLFRFLNAYDFGADAETEELKTESKKLINAPVLGLIFEKINGYKEGSFYTPSFVTLYLCREVIQKALVNRFRKETSIDANDYLNLCSQLRRKSIAERRELAQVAERLSICDPSVGSGHFLVSALNELIHALSDLHLLFDDEGNELVNEVVVAENDELIVTTRSNELLAYQVAKTETGRLFIEPDISRIQRTLFQVKRRLIENALFGVDINPSSVNICRLRLWIELLKSAYYNEQERLETLPNLDLNVQTGNSVIWTLDLKVDLSTAFSGVTDDTGAAFTFESYRKAVQSYKRATSTSDKAELRKIIAQAREKLKGQEEEKVPEALQKASGQLDKHLTQTNLFETNNKTEAEQRAFDQKTEKLQAKVNQLQAEFDREKNQTAYRHAFQWRYMFPEVLDDKGRYIGFDVVVGNPPYIRQEEIKSIKTFLKMDFHVYEGTADLLTYFIERAYHLLRPGGQFGFIISNKFTRTNYGEKLREFLLERTRLQGFIDLKGHNVFPEATVDPAILLFEKNTPSPSYEFTYARILKDFKQKGFLRDYVALHRTDYPTELLHNHTWTFEDPGFLRLKEQIMSQGKPLKDWPNLTINYGIKTGYNEAFIIDGHTRNRLIDADPRNADILKHVLRGRNIKKWLPEYDDLWLVCIPWHFPLQNEEGIMGASEESERAFQQEYPVLYAHLSQYRVPLTARNQAETGIRYEWYALQRFAASYYQDFAKPKIIYPNMTKFWPFVYDEKGYFLNDKAFMMTGDNLKYLTGIFNSRFFKVVFRNSFPDLLGETSELRKVFFEQVPIKFISPEEQMPFDALVDTIMARKASNQSIEVQEAQLELLVYDLYGLNEEQRALLQEMEV